MKKNILSFISLTLALLFLSFSLFAESEFDRLLPEQREINICAPLHSYDMNPRTASYTAEAQLFTGIYEGLFSYDPVTLLPLPALCSSYKVSRDKKRWTFTLRSDAKFSDGSSITAKDVRFSWLSLLETKGAPFASLLDSISGAKDLREGKGKSEDVRIDVRDDTTLVIHLDEPAGHLPKLLCHHAFSILSEKENVFSGPFVLESNEKNVISLKKNEYYWDRDSVKIPGIKIYLSDDYSENAYSFNDGKIDWVMGNAEPSKIIEKASIQVGAEFGTSYLFFKNASSIWSKKEFRDALLEAIPYDRLRGKYAVPAETFIFPLPGYPEVAGISDYDENDALKLMNDARVKNGIPLDEKLPIVFATSGEEYIKEWIDLLKEAWSPLGVDLQVQTTTFDRYNLSISSWDADLFHYSWIGDFADPLAFLELFRGDSSLNVSGFKLDSFDSLVKEASSIDTVSERYSLMAKAEEILLSEGIVIPISHPVSSHILDLTVIGGWKVNGLDIHPFKYLYIKSLPSSKVPNLVRFCY